MKTYTIDQIKTWLQTCDSFGDVFHYCNEKYLDEANLSTIHKEGDEVIFDLKDIDPDEFNGCQDIDDILEFQCMSAIITSVAIPGNCNRNTYFDVKFENGNIINNLSGYNLVKKSDF